MGPVFKLQGMTLEVRDLRSIENDKMTQQISLIRQSTSDQRKNVYNVNVEMIGLNNSPL